MAEPWTDEEFAAARVEARSGRITAPGVRLRDGQLQQLIADLSAHDRAAAGHVSHLQLGDAVIEGDFDFSGVTFGRFASFEAARFEGAAVFDGTLFEGGASFEGARLRASASFVGARFARVTFSTTTFSRGADFERTVWAEGADFDGARFLGNLFFDGARFEGPASFLAEVRIVGHASFERASFAQEGLFALSSFGGDASFVRTTFGSLAGFASVTFAQDVSFRRAEFHDDVDLEDVICRSEASFAQARFRAARMLGPLLVEQRLSFEQSSFDVPVRIEADALTITCDRAMFRGGVDLFAEGAEVSAEGTDFASASLLTALPRSNPGAGAPNLLGDGPRVTSLRGANVAGLTLSRVDLSPCRFANAHGLDEMRLERVTFAQPPSGWRKHRWRWIRWSGRRTIAEEHHWRAARDHSAGWNTGSVKLLGDAGTAVEPLNPAEIASIYRALRRGRERERDEPAAGAFYYGEMEMRRMRAGHPTGSRSALTERSIFNAERAILGLYWLTAGYGLRASRAIAALVLVIAAIAFPLSLWGFEPGRSYGYSVLFAAESSISLLRAPDDQLTVGGQVVTIALRILGPLLFGLAALALRSRVKR